MPRLCPPLPFHRPSEPSEFLLGRLVLPTGQLVACDPTSRLDRAQPLMRAVAPGTYAVRLGALGGDAAYVALIVGAPGAAVVKWEVALTAGPSSARGFVVDDCTAGYLDVAGIPALRREGAPDVLGRLIAAGYAERPHAVVDLGGAGNLVAFGTGTAGRFTSYWGLDRSGAPAVLVTDLGILGADRTAHVGAQVDAPRGARILPFRRR